MTLKNLRLAKPNRLAGCIIILTALVTFLLQSTGHMTWLIGLPTVAMIMSAFAPWILIILGVFLYFYK